MNAITKILSLVTAVGCATSAWADQPGLKDELAQRQGMSKKELSRELAAARESGRVPETTIGIYAGERGLGERTTTRTKVTRKAQRDTIVNFGRGERIVIPRTE